MVTLNQKKDIVKGLVAKLEESTSIFFVNFETMSVAQTNEFRNLLAEQEIGYQVAKNTLVKRALAEVDKFDVPDEVFKQQTGVLFGGENPVAPGKVIEKFFKDNEKPIFKAAIVEGQYFDSSQLKQVASLPTREDMIASIVSSLGAPASGIVGAINATMRDLASVIEEVAKKQNNAA